MSVCAVIDTAAGVVVNLIMADELDPVEAGHILRADPPSWVVLGTPWDGANYVEPVGKSAASAGDLPTV